MSSSLARLRTTIHVDNVTRPRANPIEVLLAMITAWWEWCREQAAPGWMITLVATMIMFVLFATRLEASIGALIRQCAGVQ